MATATVSRSYDVGGVELERPFRVLRLGHFGFNVTEQEPALRFYSDLLGLPMTDTRNFGEMMKLPNPTGRDGKGYFLRVGGDHHSVVLFPHWTQMQRPGDKFPGAEWISHMAWQCATLSEVTEGKRWLTERQTRIARPGGRDARGANWNFTVTDADGISNEIYYGMDQIGWDGVSKPLEICPDGDPLPEIGGTADPDFPMAKAAIEGGLDLRKGLHQRPFGEPKYDVGGVRLARPFRIIRNGPIGLFAADVAAATAFYRDAMGLTVTETVDYHGHHCVFLRANTEHHTMALYPLGLRDELGMRGNSICRHYGMQVGTYKQLKDAVKFLKDNGVTIRMLPPELTPGIDYAAYALDPDGHAVMLYYYMEQIGWDGRPRPAELRRKVDIDAWPDTLAPLSDTYRGTVFQGPLG